MGYKFALNKIQDAELKGKMCTMIKI